MRTWLVGTITVHRGAAHMASLALIIVEGIMPATAIIPKGDRILGPAETTREPLIARMLEQEIQQRAAFAFGHAGKAEREGWIDIEALATGLRMRAYHGVFIFRGIGSHL